MTKGVTEIKVSDYVKEAMTTYGKYVLSDRAVADLADGLKPVQRRILWAMFNMKLYPDRNFKKCATTVGEVIGKYHPHGDASSYGALVSMTHQRYPLIEGHGNFGSLDGDPPAAYRYTEARLSKLAMKVFECIDISDKQDNFSGEVQEPVVIPSRAPLLFINGTTGIGVGIAASAPPHNLKEIVDILLLVLKAKKIPTISDIFKVFNGPDHYMGGVITSDPSDVQEVYKNGQGTIHYRCNYKFAEIAKENALIVTSFAPSFNAEKFIASCHKLSEDGQLLYVANESSADNGVRIIVGFKNSAIIEEKVIGWLHTYEHYQFHVLRYADEEAEKPTLLSFTDLIQSWLDYQREVETMMLQRERKKFEEQLSREEAKLLIIKNWDDFQKIVGSSTDKDSAIVKIEDLGLTNDQAIYVWGIPVGSFVNYEQGALKGKIKDINAEISRIARELHDIDVVIERHLKELLDFSDDRIQQLNITEPKLSIPKSQFYVGVSKAGWMTRTDSSPTRGRKLQWEFLIRETNHATIVQDCNIAGLFGPQYLKDGDTTYKDIVGVIPSSCDKYIALSEDGYGICIEHPQKIAEYPVIRKATKILKAIGLMPGCTVICYDNTTIKIYDHSDPYLTTVRRNSSGYRFLPRKKSYEILVIPPDGKLVDDAGEEFDLSKKRHVNAIPGYAKGLWVAGKLNFVMWGNGKKELLTQKELLKEMKTHSKIPNVVYPI
jgi:DNA gyrase subunit A